MDLGDFDFYRTLLHKLTGMALTQEKTFLVESRLLPVARKWGYSNLQSLSIALRAMPPAEMLDDLAEAMINDETSFFRDITPFEDMVQVAIPALMQTRRRQKRLRIWSCGTGTGQEAWSIAMALKKMHPQLANWRIDIWATDLSYQSLALAAQATYSQAEIQRGLPVADLQQWFEPVDKKWRVKPALRQMVSFESFNIMQDNVPSNRIFDIIFCRHVMDDFDDSSRQQAFSRLRAPLAPDGFLLLGPGENPAGIYEPFMPLPENSNLFILADLAVQDALAH